VEWPNPHSWVQITWKVPIRSGVITAVVVIPGTLSFLIRHSGTQNEWITSWECILKTIWRLTGTRSSPCDQTSPLPG
jgi:hypothetical protein